MRKALAVVIICLLGLALPGPALAGLDESRAWFEQLEPRDRQGVQYDLVLLGHFGFVIDGQFGENTFEAIARFQRANGLEASGVLDAAQRQLLFETADVVYQRLGMAGIEDAEGRSSLVLPAGLLSEVTPQTNGNSYASTDGGIVLETLVTPHREKSFSELFAAESAVPGGLVVTAASFTPDRFVISGTRDGRAFHMLYQNAGTESVGYILSWTEANAADAAIVKLIVASYFVPLRLRSNPDGDKATTSTANAFGVWSLPDEDPTVIALNGEIGATLDKDFERALEARPAARVLLLNSPGGYVDNALVVARKVRERGMDTLVAKGMGCYSACSYIYFAGASRAVDGELGVHQISAEVADLVLAQTTLADVLSALDAFEVTQSIITVMLQTPPAEMYIFNRDEIVQLGINRGGPIRVAMIEGPVPGSNNVPEVSDGPAVEVSAGASYVLLAWRESAAEAERSLSYAQDVFGAALGSAMPEITVAEARGSTLYGVRVPAASAENANAICAAVKSAGGGCYVTGR